MDKIRRNQIDQKCLATENMNILIRYFACVGLFSFLSIKIGKDKNFAG